MKGQASLEYIITFGVAIIIISVVGLSLWRMGVFTPSKKEMVIESPKYFDIPSFSLKNNTLYLDIMNTRLGSSAKIVRIEVSGTLSGNETFSVILPQDSLRNFSIPLSQSCQEGKYYTLSIKIFFQKESLSGGFSSIESVDFGKISVLCTSGVSQTQSEPWLEGFSYRREINITENSGNTLYEYQVRVVLDTSSLISQGKMNLDCSDIRVTDSDKLTLLPYYIEYGTCNTPNTMIWVKVPEIPAGGVKKIYLYYGNSIADSLSNISTVFSYSEPRTVGYLVSERLASSGNIKVISLEDGNTICLGSECVNLNKGETYSFTGTYSVNTPVKAKKLFQLDGVYDGTDIFSPISWAGKEFHYYVYRGTNTWCILSPFGDANVVIKRGITNVWSGIIRKGTGSCLNVDITDRYVASIESDIPVLAQHYSIYNGNPADSRVLYPATNETLYGVPSQFLEIGAGSTGASVTVYLSTGSSFTINFGSYAGTYRSGYASLGNAPAAKVVVSSGVVGADQLADSDGLETTTFLPSKELGTVFGSALPAGYIAIATPYENTECCLYKGDGSLIACNSSTGTNVYKICFGCGNTYPDVVTPWILKCNKPVFAYYEKDFAYPSEYGRYYSDETNLISYKQMRQYVYPEPTISIGLEERWEE